MALMSQYGRPRDAAAYSIMSIESGPFLTMLTLGVAGFSFDRLALLGAILPLVVGMILGNLDAKMREFLGAAVPVLIPFFAFALGTTINLYNLWRSGLLGIGLGLFVVVFTGSRCSRWTHQRWQWSRRPGGGIDRRQRRRGPALVAAANPAYGDAAKSATVLVSASILVTAFLVPVVTAWWAGTAKRRFPVGSKPDSW